MTDGKVLRRIFPRIFMGPPVVINITAADIIMSGKGEIAIRILELLILDDI